MSAEKSRQQSLPLMVKTGVLSALKDVHTSIPGIIDSFDPATQTAKVTPSVKRVLKGGREIQLTQITDVPVYFMRAGGFVITHPVTKGMECWIHFSERSIDSWKKFGDIRVPNDKRMHDITDAFIVPCVTSQINPIESFDNQNVNIINTGSEKVSKITLKPSGEVEITGESLKLNGDVTVDGKIEATGDITTPGSVVAETEVTAGPEAAAVNLTTHTHGYVSPSGPSNTAPPTAPS